MPAITTAHTLPLLFGALIRYCDDDAISPHAIGLATRALKAAGELFQHADAEARDRVRYDFLTDETTRKGPYSDVVNAMHPDTRADAAVAWGDPAFYLGFACCYLLLRGEGGVQ